jgi:hypothetical protein
MSIFRLVIAWLIMAALPLQGMAASSMLFCDQAAPSTVAKPTAHDHAAHGHGAQHDHASHSHDGDSLAAADQPAKLSQQQADGPQGAGMVEDGHACPICAACCNLVALSETPILALQAAPPASQPLDGPSRVLSRDAPTPDKPPRA